MVSLRARLFTAFMRLRVKPKLARVTDVGQLGEGMREPTPRTPHDLRIEPATVAGVPGEWISRRDRPAAATLLYLHGGGYVACSPATHRPITTFFARRGLRVFAPAYRLAPRHPFPAAFDDALAVARALGAETGGALRIAGDSAGGGLALAVAAALARDGGPVPCRAAAFSPWTDLALTGASLDRNDEADPMFPASFVRRGPVHYLAGADPADPRASPLFADPAGLPPILIHVGTTEVLLDDSTRFADRARAAGVPVTLRLWPVVPHVWQIAHRILPEGRRSLAEAARFLLSA